jgi:hypothetical protein
MAVDARGAPAGAIVGPTPASLQAHQARLDGFVAVAVWLWAAASIASLLLIWAESDYFHALWHWAHLVVQAGNAGQTAPQPPAVPAWSVLSWVLSLGVLGIEVAFLIWQHHAAGVARALGYPARHTPGWGVGWWFVPVVNLWMPYQALRDCLPPGHGDRRSMLVAWVAFQIGNLLLAAAFVAVIVDRPVGVALVVATVVARAGFGLYGYRALRAVAADHREALAALGVGGIPARA